MIWITEGGDSCLPEHNTDRATTRALFKAQSVDLDADEDGERRSNNPGEFPSSVGEGIAVLSPEGMGKEQTEGYLAPRTYINQEVPLPEPALDLALLSS